MSESKEVLAGGNDTFDMLDGFINNDEVGFCVTDLQTRKILFANHKLALYAGKSDSAALTGECCQAYTEEMGGEGGCPFCTRENLMDGDGGPSEPHIREIYLESLGVWLRIINQNVMWTGGRMIHMVTFYDITEAKRMHEQLAESMYKDRLLGIKNEAGLDRDIQEAVHKPSLILFNVLSLRKINESYGRETGDYLLSSIRDWIFSQGIQGAELYRIGGDKFCLAVVGIGGTEITRLADKLSRLMAKPWTFEYEQKRLWISCNVSIAVIPNGYIRDDESLLSMIDRMLERARGKRRVAIFDWQTDKAHKGRIELELSLERCVHESMRGFDMHYQPIVESESGIWCGLEALCRWNSPELGAISPHVFIPVVEQLGLIGPLGLWTLETAVRRCKQWELDRCEGFILDVNLSAAQFADKSLASDIISIIQKYDYPGERLCIELTESTNVTFQDQSLRAIERLRTHNILVALDDFGTGYSSFNRLKSMPVDIVKIERVFVADIEHDEYHRYLFHAMAELAHTANMKLVAEGVERGRQMDILVKDGADYLQGYLFSRPLPPGELEKELSRFYDQIPYRRFVDRNGIGDAAI